MSNKRFKTWDINGTESSKLQELFNLYQQTEGKAGINPDLTKPSIILEQVYHQHEFLHTLNKSYFADRFRSLANKWKLNKALTTGRKRKFNYFLIYFIIFFFL
jgi:hypothetical protein